MDDKDGGPAFPTLPNRLSIERGDPGMTLRDYFAGQALAGLLADMAGADEDVRADMAYNQADAMLLRRKDPK